MNSQRLRIVHKYGGSSLAEADGFLRVVAALSVPKSEQRIVVVSAPGGVTDTLIDLFALASTEQPWRKRYQGLISRIKGLMAALDVPVSAEWQLEFAQLGAALEERAASSGWISRGEYWSSWLLHAALRRDGHDAVCLDARHMILVDQYSDVIESETYAAIQRNIYAAAESMVLVQGFVAGNEAGEAVTLGRNGSDYTASIVAAAIEAKQLTIWSDTDGVLTADPDLIPSARPVTQISYRGLDTLARLGTGVVHPDAVGPVMRLGLPLYLANSFRPHVPGTEVRNDVSQNHAVVTASKHLALIHVQHDAPEKLINLFGNRQLLAWSIVNTQIELLVHDKDLAETLSLLRDCETTQLIDVDTEQLGLFLVSPAKEVSARTKAFIEGLNAQPVRWLASDSCIAAVIGASDLSEVVRRVHDHLSNEDGLQILLLGDGPTAASLVESLAEARDRQAGPLFSLQAVVGAAQMIWNPDGWIGSDWEPWFQSHAQSTSISSLLRQSQVAPGRHKVIVDVREGHENADYPIWLEQGFDVITANRALLSGDWSIYEAIQQAQERHGTYLMCEGAVNGAVWAIDRIRHVMETGDSVVSIRGILCGFQSWLWARLAKGQRFSDLIAEAIDTGIAQPDPRIDLAGTHAVQRWILLARECGFQAEMERCSSESIIPAWMLDLDFDEFLDVIHTLDDFIERRVTHAVERGRSLAYVGTMSANGSILLRLESLKPGDPLTGVEPGDMYLEVGTHKLTRPLVLAGPGIGPDAAASGVLSDLIKIAARRGIMESRSRYTESFHEALAAST